MTNTRLGIEYANLPKDWFLNIEAEDFWNKESEDDGERIQKKSGSS